MMFTIGEFSKVTGLTIKTLRFYHQRQLLVPSCVHPETGYRYYAPSKVENARVITALRDLEVSLDDIADILQACDDEADLVEFLQQHQQHIAERMHNDRRIHQSIARLITKEKEARVAMQQSTFQVEEKNVDSQQIAAYRMKGAYQDCGKGFSRIGRKFGRHICGKPLMLCYDEEYREDDADFEVCLPVRRGSSTDDISVRELPGGPAVTLLYQGPYDDIHRAYATLLGYVKDHGYQVAIPTREVYLKGPGMILKGNPKKYLTEIQMLVRDPSDGE